METDKTHTGIEQTLNRKKPGDLLFPTDFRGKGTDTAIRKAFSRLARQGKIRRLAQGIYYLPKIDPVLGEVRPGVDEVMELLAKKEKIKVRPSGAYALHQLGLTTQVPTRRVYITDGSARFFHIGKLSIRFKPTTPKRLSTKGPVSSLLIQALDEIGIDGISIHMEQKIIGLLKKEDPRKLRHDLELAPAKIHDYLLRLIQKEQIW